ncbi:hypothetical protein BDW71DRAFT_148967 [Aspergillus fruticulosus]
MAFLVSSLIVAMLSLAFLDAIASQASACLPIQKLHQGSLIGPCPIFGARGQRGVICMACAFTIPRCRVDGGY